MNQNHRHYAEMAKLAEKGWTLQRIGDRFELSRERVRQIIGNVGRERSSTAKKTIAENIDKIMSMWAQGRSMNSIARAVGVCSGSLTGHLKLQSQYRGFLVHGTRNGYLKWRCRCDQCREANNSYARDRAKKKRRERKNG